MKKSTVKRWIALILCVLICAGALFALADTEQAGSLNAGQVNLRKSPAQTSASLGRYEKDTALIVEEAVTVDGADWFHVRIGDKTGFIMAKFVDLAEPAAVGPSAIPPELAAAVFIPGERSAAVLQVKEKMRELGYFTQNAELSDAYNDTMTERIRQFQANNGLPSTGRIDTAFLTALYGPVPVTGSLLASGAAQSTESAAKSASSGNTAKASASESSSKSTVSGSQTSSSKSSAASGSGSVSAPYIGNRNTMKFHHSWCSSVKQMKESNKVGFNSRTEALNQGYVPCKNCNP